MKKIERVLILGTLFLLTMGLLTPAWAQGNVTINIEQIQVDENTFPEMSAIVSVVNPSRVPISGLTENEFEVYEGNNSLPVVSVDVVTDTNQTLAVALILDLSKSSPIEEAKAAANWLLDSLGPNDSVALIGFNTPPELNTFDPEKEVDFTTDKEKVRQVINGFDESSLVGVSAVYQAIYKGVYITVNQSADRRAVVVVTDGYQYGTPEFDSEKAKTLAQDERIPIFTIGVYNPPDYYEDEAYLKSLAEETGAQYQEATDPSRLTKLFQDVVGQLWLKYKLTFHNPDLPRDGKDHVLTFQVSTPEGNDTVNRTVSYPGPPPVPEILKIQQDINGDLNDLRQSLKGQVLLVPKISAQNPIVEVQYWLDDEIIHTVVVDVQADKRHAPWEWKWDTCNASEGQHTVAVVARDDTGAQSDKYTVNVEIDRGGAICIPVLGEVQSTTVIVVGAGLLLLLILLLALIVASLRRRQEPAPIPLPVDSPTVPGGPFVSAPAPPAPAPPPPPTPQQPYVPTMPGSAFERPSAGAPAGSRPEPKTEILHKAPEAMGWLIAQGGPLSGREFRLGQTTSIGRTGENDIVLDDPAVSRQHAKVKLEGKVFFIYDLGSTNTTKVNGQEIGRHQLTDGDRVEIGRSQLVFKQIEPT